MSFSTPYGLVHHDRSKVIRAPTPEQTAFTASLSKPRTPPVRRVWVPQLCTGRSVDFAHTSHQRRVCRVAPSRESATDPANPPSTTAVNGAGQRANAAPAAMNSAPPILASVPITLTPPEVPAGTLRPETIETGLWPVSVPISVAQVSAADAASAPIPTAYHVGVCDSMYAIAASAYTLPLARTCLASRRSPFSTTGPISFAFLLSPRFERALAEMKCATRRIPQLQPAARAIAPTTVPATAPLVERARIRRAPNATMPAPISPAITRATSSVSCDYLVPEANPGMCERSTA